LGEGAAGVGRGRGGRRVDGQGEVLLLPVPRSGKGSAVGKGGDGGDGGAALGSEGGSLGAPGCGRFSAGLLAWADIGGGLNEKKQGG
jgi:hypothetical protein